MWESVELREIRVFLALAEQLHFGRAADQLGVTQSRVSQSLRELELKLGADLVHRTSRRVSLTATGERFLAEVTPAYEHLANVLRDPVGDEGELRGQLKLGLLNALPQPPQLIDLVRAFERGHPGCGVEIKELRLSTEYESLRGGDVDLIAGPPTKLPELVSGPLLSEAPRVLAVAADHPLSGRASVTTDDIADYEVVDLRGLVPNELAPRLIPRHAASGRPMKRRRLEHHDWSELQMSIATGRIVHPAFDGQFAHPGIRCVPISDLPPWETALVWRAGDDGRLLRAFVETATVRRGRPAR